MYPIDKVILNEIKANKFSARLIISYFWYLADVEKLEVQVALE